MAAAKESMPTVGMEEFERELRALASWHASSAADYVDEAISENCKFVPKKLQNKRSYNPPRYNTRKKTRDYKQKVRDVADQYRRCLQHHEKPEADAKQK